MLDYRHATQIAFVCFYWDCTDSNIRCGDFTYKLGMLGKQCTWRTDAAPQRRRGEFDHKSRLVPVKCTTVLSVTASSCVSTSTPVLHSLFVSARAFLAAVGYLRLADSRSHQILQLGYSVPFIRYSRTTTTIPRTDIWTIHGPSRLLCAVLELGGLDRFAGGWRTGDGQGQLKYLWLAEIWYEYV